MNKLNNFASERLLEGKINKEFCLINAENLTDYLIVVKTFIYQI